MHRWGQIQNSRITDKRIKSSPTWTVMLKLITLLSKIPFNRAEYLTVTKEQLQEQNNDIYIGTVTETYKETGTWRGAATGTEAGTVVGTGKMQEPVTGQ